MGDTLRLFLALRLPANVVESVDGFLADVRDRHPELRWIPPERWHLTLAFFGSVAPDRLARLRRQVTRRIGTQAPLELELTGAGRFGDRVLWTGVGGDVEGLRALGQRVAVDERPYRPHLTVARARPNADLRQPVELLRDYTGPTWVAADIELLESHLGPRPTYETLDTWPLTAARAGN